jgi:hypothetical protein
MNIDLIKKLKRHGTWQLFGLWFITLGIYTGYYIKRQSKLINELIPEGQEKISPKLVTFIFILGYLSAALFFPFFIVEEGHPIETVSTILDYIWGFSVCGWGFIAGALLNVVNSAEKGSKIWFGKIWSLLFGALYINYKINKLNKMIEEANVPTPSTSSE